MFLELRERLSSLTEWKACENAYPELRSVSYIGDLAASVRAGGFVDPLHGFVASGEYTLRSTNYREDFTAYGCAARHRAVVLHMLDYVLANGWCSTVFLAEDGTAFANALPERFPYCFKAAYLPELEGRQAFPNLRHEDPVALSLPDHSFDLYISLDTMIYAPSTPSLLREAHRVLRRTGVFLATMAFRYGETLSQIRAEIVDQELVHRSDPLYFADPLDPARKRLVYSIPGWDILEQARQAGFRSAEIVAHSSRIHAILGTEIAAVFVLEATA